MNTIGKLSIVATPIGNLEDMTLRAIRVLKEADYILCEDTRVTGKLLKHYEIESKMKRYDAHAPESVHESILADLEEGKHFALVSDAGTPGVSDPGVLLVQRARAAGALVEAIPGASAIIAAFSIAGLTGNEFVFLGFIPHKKGRETFFKSLADYEMPVIFYESPHRIMKTLASLEKYYGQTTKVSEREDSTDKYTITIAREITKMHEEVVQGTPEEVLQYFTDNSDHVKGEFVVIVSS